MLFRLAAPAYRLVDSVPKHWEKEGVIRSGWTKVWREDNPKRFAFRVDCFRVGAAFVWIWLKAVGVILMGTAVVEVLEYLVK